MSLSPKLFDVSKSAPFPPNHTNSPYKGVVIFCLGDSWVPIVVDGGEDIERGENTRDGET